MSHFKPLPNVVKNCAACGRAFTAAQQFTYSKNPPHRYQKVSAACCDVCTLLQEGLELMERARSCIAKATALAKERAAKEAG